MDTWWNLRSSLVMRKVQNERWGRGCFRRCRIHRPMEARITSAYHLEKTCSTRKVDASLKWSRWNLYYQNIKLGSCWVLSQFYSSSSTSSKIAFLFEPRIIRDVTNKVHSLMPDYHAQLGCMNCRKSRDKPPTNRCMIWSTEVTIASLLLWHHLLRFLWPCRKHPGDV